MPYCAPATTKALAAAAADGEKAFQYPTCTVLEKKLYGDDTPVASDFTMWKTSLQARNGNFYTFLP